MRSTLESRGWGTDPSNPDTDGDGNADGVEIFDVNGDGAATFTDALIVAKAAALATPFNGGPLTAEEKHAYDMTRDGVVTFADALLLAKYAGGYPAC